MSSRAEARDLTGAEARVLGRFARAALDAGEATVFAAFERSCYVETQAGIACLGGMDLGLGPLNVLLTAFTPRPVGTRIAVSMGHASVWTPPHAKLSKPVPDLPIPEAIRKPGQAFLAWLAGKGEPDESLIGLGPGLTPAGDDFVGGAMIALRTFGHANLADRIAAWALPLAEERTSRISRAHLECAAQGEGHEALHDWLHGFKDSDYRRLEKIGHTSGLDAAAGAAAVLSEVRP